LHHRHGGYREYWKNLFAWLTAEGFSIALINPIRTRRFAEKELQRTKTDHVDALAIARFAAQKRLKPTKLSERFAQELRALVHLRNQTIQHLGDHTRHLHKAIDLPFQSSRGTYAGSIRNSRRPFCLAIQLPLHS
jgi:transposase